MKNKNNKRDKRDKKDNEVSTQYLLDALCYSIADDVTPALTYHILLDLVNDIDRGKYVDLADLRDYTQSWLLNNPLHEYLNSINSSINNNISTDLDVKTKDKIKDKVNLKKYVVPKNNNPKK